MIVRSIESQQLVHNMGYTSSLPCVHQAPLFYMKSSALVPKSSNASSYALVSNLETTSRQLRRTGYVRIHSLSPNLRSTQPRFSRGLWLLLPARLVPLLLLLLVRKSCESASSLPDLDVLQRRSERAGMMLDE